jgi:flavin reductase (DIM6/NTAB) family NADH-FMN oxidoreductase RutF
VNLTAVFRATDRELWLLTARAGDRRGGLIATFVSEASIAPEMPRVLVGLARQHATWELVTAARSFALHLLAADQMDLVWRFGLQSGRDSDKLDGIPWQPSANGNLVLTDSPAWLECRVETSFNMGDRTLFLAEVLDGGLRDNRPILTMQTLVRTAPADKLQQMRENRARDAAIDVPLISAWRQTHGEPGA